MQLFRFRSLLVSSVTPPGARGAASFPNRHLNPLPVTGCEDLPIPVITCQHEQRLRMLYSNNIARQVNTREKR